ncbi:zinc ribbon domain-containing protein [Congregibacter variabilis]|uniref:Zinc ribbon domain-containing protein n=1 Tax=Congregibacter variabilis TaxID=3081200 RepID=A0ABZ0HYU9_9GAMM|nr:zinc ribbon domain-containing protein [Congregibacter sp. IMCC43200]
MPIYEYQCTECGALHEALRKISDPPLTECPACGKSTLRKKVSAAAFRLAGSGWYETDFKSGNKKNLAGDSASDKPGGDKSGDMGGDKGGDKKDSSAAKPSKSDTSSGSPAA